MVVVTSTANPAVKAARKLARRHGRTRAGEAFLVEGPQALREAGPFLRQLFVTASAETDHAQLVASAREAGADVVVVTDDVLAEIATTVTPQGVVGIAAVPPVDLGVVLASATMVVVLHQVRDPGNAGTAIRTADAAGADAVVLTAGSVDRHNPKAVRASAGSVFHLPVVGDVGFDEVVRECHTAGVKLVAAAADAATSYTDADLGGRVALVFGNEAHGLGAHVPKACDEVVRIPIHEGAREGYTGSAESLNLAATVAVLGFESARQRGGAAAGGVHHRAAIR